LEQHVSPEQAYIGLGCNLGDRLRNLHSAIDALDALDSTSDIQCSSFYESEPMGPADQPDYINAVVGLLTTQPPHELLKNLQSIEQKHGRIRTGERWGARTLDLDLLLYGQQQIKTDNLTVPHPGMPDRSFVLLPLSELAPDINVPGFGEINDLLSECQQFGIRRLNSTA
jgi:2-amino-4-hydroxy-6-hydroxymethyldihydropteridine diphosphokinase